MKNSVTQYKGDLAKALIMAILPTVLLMLMAIFNEVIFTKDVMYTVIFAYISFSIIFFMFFITLTEISKKS